jgi:hypothetical protein
MTHDHKRNGATALFATFTTLRGPVVGQCFRRHLHQGFIRFLRMLDKEFPGGVPLFDNYATH